MRLHNDAYPLGRQRMIQHQIASCKELIKPYAIILIEKTTMRIYLQIIGIPKLKKIIGTDVNIDAECNTILDLIDWLCQNYGKQVKDTFFPDGKSLSMNIQVLVNNKLVLPRERLKETKVEDNDKIAFMIFIGGG